MNFHNTKQNVKLTKLLQAGLLHSYINKMNKFIVCLSTTLKINVIEFFHNQNQ